MMSIKSFYSLLHPPSYNWSQLLGKMAWNIPLPREAKAPHTPPRTHAQTPENMGCTSTNPNQNKHGVSSVKAEQFDDLAMLLSAAKTGQQKIMSWDNMKLICSSSSSRYKNHPGSELNYFFLKLRKSQLHQLYQFRVTSMDNLIPEVWKA